MSPLHTRLENIKKDCENKQDWVIFIYSYIEKDFINLCEIFSVDPINTEAAKDILYHNVMLTINELIEDHTRQIWMTGYIRKLWVPWTSPKFALWWARLECTLSEEWRRENCRRDLLERKKNKAFKRIFRSIMWTEPVIVIEDSEIEEWVNARCWPHVSVLTEKWIEIIDWFQTIRWQEKLSDIRKRRAESVADILN